MRRPAYLTVFGLLLLATADAAEQQAKLPGQGADACALVSKAEIEQTLGVKLGDGEKNPSLQTPGVVSTCDYKTSDFGQVIIVIRRRQIKYEGTATVESKKLDVKQGHIPGLGRDAFLTETAGMAWSLSIFRGDYDFIGVSVIGVTPTAPASAAIEKLGRMVLDRWK
ncbi:MAG: hypothetical protein ABSG26_24195 [Bryobacteraceae bacterium]|jgi:hypothetical protein